MSSVKISGYAAPGFDNVRAQFAEHFQSEGEVGAALCIERDGETLVDLWGGHRDDARTRAWDADTLANVWSTSKGAMAATIAHLVSSGRLDYTAPVSRYWPEFGAAGKQDVTVAQLFSHQAGLAGTDQPLSVDELYDVKAVSEVLAAQAPQWSVGSRSGYHAISIGYLSEALVRRVTGHGLGEEFASAIATPLGLDFYLGLPESRESQISEILSDGWLHSDRETFNHLQIVSQVHMPISPELPNNRRWRAMGIPSAGGMASGRGIAGLYSHLLSDLRGQTHDVSNTDVLQRALTLQISNEDLVLRMPIHWGIGFAINADTGFYGPSPSAFGHHGWGGSSGFADPETGLAFGYALNFMREASRGDPRAGNLIRETYAAIAAISS
jgi:CubicO group peptidase (beta-lactamase class C family)